MYAYVEDGKVKEVHDQIPQNWKNISGLNLFSAEKLAELGWKKIVLDERVIDPDTSIYKDTKYTLDRDGHVKQEHQYYFIGQGSSAEDQLWRSVRMTRDRHMQETEWRYARHHREVRLGLEPTDSLEALDTYMQALADVTKQDNPLKINWPTL